MAEIKTNVVDETVTLRELHSIKLKHLLYFTGMFFCLLLVYVMLEDLFNWDSKKINRMYGSFYYITPIVFLSLLIYRPLYHIIIKGEFFTAKKARWSDLYRVISFLAIIQCVIIYYLSYKGIAVVFIPLSMQDIFPFIGMVLLAPLLEETLFRAILFKYLNQRFHIIIAVLVSSALFGLAHMDSLEHIFAAFFGGILLCIVYYKSNIYFAILLHSLHNLITQFIHLEQVLKVKSTAMDFCIRLFM